MIKKIMSLLLVVVMLSSFVCFAAKTGDVAGNYYYVDVKTYMRNQLIDAYNVGNKTVILAEALRSYGFDVVWSAEERTLTITDNKGAAVSNAQGTPTGVEGAVAGKYYHTDIVAIFNGTPVESYNIGGQTVIPAAALRQFGFNVVWDDETNRVLIDTDPNKVPSNAKPVVAPSVPVSPSTNAAYTQKAQQTYRNRLVYVTKSISFNGYELLTSNNCYIYSASENKYYIPFNAFADCLGITYSWNAAASTMSVVVPADDVIKAANSTFKSAYEPTGILQYTPVDVEFNIEKGGELKSNIGAVLYGSELFVCADDLASALGMYCFNGNEIFTASLAYYMYSQGM